MDRLLFLQDVETSEVLKLWMESGQLLVLGELKILRQMG